MKHVVSAMYLFVTLDNHPALAGPLRAAMKENGVRGTLLLAREGINGTVAGTRQGLDRFLAQLKCDPRLTPIRCKESCCDKMPFFRAKVKVKKEIVTMGVPGIDPQQLAGTYVKPRDWNALISNPGTVLIDVRNRYEVAIGTFKNAVDPNTQTFRAFPRYVRDHLDPAQHKSIATFCTGGIRCEKATAYLKQEGFKNVYHLEGGILQYLHDVPETESMWQGECFVFDRRVAVDHSLNRGRHDLCYACQHPVTQEDKSLDSYLEGVSCPQCFDKTTDQQRGRFRERQKQIRLAKSRGETHIGR